VLQHGSELPSKGARRKNSYNNHLLFGEDFNPFDELHSLDPNNTLYSSCNTERASCTCVLTKVENEGAEINLTLRIKAKNTKK
jgi:hypothetical protein